jgi:anti-sigma regulatory factor (Ser/Thr protein kinase)
VLPDARFGVVRITAAQVRVAGQLKGPSPDLDQVAAHNCVEQTTRPGRPRRRPARALPEARHRLARWLASENWPEVAAEDIVLTVNEAVANVIDHAYLDDAPGIVQVRCTIEPLENADNEPSRRVQASITDQGAWTDERHTVDPRGFRGHGMAIMAACVEEVCLHRESTGTTVVLNSYPAVDARTDGAG